MTFEELEEELQEWLAHVKSAEDKGLKHTANYCRKFVHLTREKIKKLKEPEIPFV